MIGLNLSVLLVICKLDISFALYKNKKLNTGNTMVVNAIIMYTIVSLAGFIKSSRSESLKVPRYKASKGIIIGWSRAEINFEKILN